METSVWLEMRKRDEAWLLVVAVFQDGNRRHVDHTGVRERLTPGYTEGVLVHRASEPPSLVWILLLPFIGLAKNSFGFLCNILQKKPNELFGQPNTNTLTCTKSYKLFGLVLLNWKMSMVVPVSLGSWGNLMEFKGSVNVKCLILFLAECSFRLR